MNTRSKLLSYEARTMLIGGLAVLVLGFGTATAAITVGAQPQQANPALRPLAAGPAIQIQPNAYGEDDEDCVWVTSKTVGENGRVKLLRKLECAQ
jgi:hypothetical protein